LRSLRRAYAASHGTGLVDAILAAVALAYDLTLVTEPAELPDARPEAGLSLRRLMRILGTLCRVNRAGSMDLIVSAPRGP
jgi:hypothetical protein